MGPTGTLWLAGVSADALGRPPDTEIEVVTTWPDVVFVAVMSRTPTQAAPIVATDVIVPLELVVPVTGLNVTVQPVPPLEKENVTLLPGAPGVVNVAVSVTCPPGATVVGIAVNEAPALPV